MLYLCDFGFILLLCSLQGFKVVSGAVVIHKLPSSLRDTRLRKTEKRVTPIFPSSQNCKTSQEKNPPLHPASKAPHTLPTQGLPLDPPHRLPREMALGATCDKQHSRGSSSGGEKTHQRKAKGSSQQALPLGDMSVFRTVAPLLPKPHDVPASYRHCFIVFRAS